MCERLDVECNKNFQVKYIPHKLLVGGGPPNCSPGVLHALSQPPLSAVCEELYLLMDELQEMLKYVFQTKNPVTVAMQSAGSGGIEAVLVNLLKSDEKMLVPVTGRLGARAVEMAKRTHAKVVEVNAEIGEVFSLDALEKEIIQHKPDLLLIVHGETSIGVVQPLESIGELCEKYNCLFVVDAIGSLGCTPFFADRWKIDAAIATSNKAMRGPSGLTYLTLSPKAFERIKSIKPSTFYFDLQAMAKVWNCFGERLNYYYTFDTHFLFAAKEGIAEIIRDGLVETWNNYKLNCERLHVGMKKLGCPPFVQNPNILLPMISTFHLPLGVNVHEVIKYASEKYQVKFTHGLGFGMYASASKCIRIGLMGYNSRAEVVEYVLKVLEDILKYYHVKNEVMSNGK